MDRLYTWIVVLAALALAACSGSSPVERDGGAGQSGLDGPNGTAGPVTDPEIFEARPGTPVSPEISALLRPAKAPAGLPPLPLDGLPDRLPQALEQSFKDGDQSYDASANATDDGATKILDSSDGQLAWAIYEVPLVSATAEITKLYVTASDWVSSAEGPQGWIYGLANYDTNRWQTLGYTSNTSTERTMSVTAPYRGPGGNAYIFVATSNLQSITVVEVGFDLEVIGWNEVTLDSGSAPDWTQGIDFTLTDNPAIAYTKASTGKAWFAVADRQTDVLNAGNWVPVEIDPTNPRPAKWIDMVIDDETGLPRASYITSGHPAETGRTQLNFAAVFLITGDPPTPVWFPYGLKRTDETFEDGAAWTSIDKLQGPLYPQAFGFVTHVANDTFRSSGEQQEFSFDLQYREFYLNDLEKPTDITVQRTAGFGELYLYPHFSFSFVDDPAPTYGFAVNGGNNLAGSVIEELVLIQEEEVSTSFGSMATSPADETLGSTYVGTPLDEDRLMYTGYDAGLFGVPEMVTSAGTQAGGWIGTSQLAYAPDGTPGIVFTESDGSAVYVKFATLIDEAWFVETVSNDPSVPDDLMDDLSVIVDLAYDSAGIPAICYNHVDGTTGSLRFAIRE